MIEKVKQFEEDLQSLTIKDLTNEELRVGLSKVAQLIRELNVILNTKYRI